MLYYALFYATAIPTIVYAQVVGDESNEPTILGDDISLESMIDLSDLPWLEDEIFPKSTAVVASQQVQEV